MNKFKDWLRAKYRIGTITDKQLQELYEGAGMSRSLLLRWVYDDYELQPMEAEALMVQVAKMNEKSRPVTEYIPDEAPTAI